MKTKKYRNLLSILLALVMVTGLLPTAAFAAEKTEVQAITSISATVTAPEAGKTPKDIRAAAPADANYTVSLIRCCSDETGKILPTDYIFEAGKPYCIDVRVTPNSGYEISKSASMRVNEDDSISSGLSGIFSNSVMYSVYFTVAAAPTNVIDKIAATIRFPSAGQIPTDTVVTAPADANYTVEFYRCRYRFDAGEGRRVGYDVPMDEPLQADKPYMVEVLIGAKEGYEISEEAILRINEDYDISATCTAMVGDKAVYTTTHYPKVSGAYTVKHMQEKLDALGTYEEVKADTQTLTGNVGENTAAAAKEYPGFAAKTITQKKITEDGSTVVEIQYDRKHLIIKFDANGGEGSMEDLVFVFDELKDLPANTFTREGYTFKEWNFAADGSGPQNFADEAGMTFTNGKLPDPYTLTLYAQWEKDETPHIHAFDKDWEHDNTHHWHMCSCGEKADEAAHTYGEWTIVTPATETAQGLRKHTCSVCGYEESEAISKLEPKPTEPKPTEPKPTEPKPTEPKPTEPQPTEPQPTEPQQYENPFTDLKQDEYYVDPVLWAVHHGVTVGATATTFEPDSTCTRAQIITFLWRAAGAPAPKQAKTPFTDLQTDAYYMDAAAWAVENGITIGTSETTFSPNEGCTRAQVVTFLWRFQNKPAPKAPQTPFTDLKTGEYYLDAVAWAVENGITVGATATTFEPDSTCTRAQIVTFLYRALGK